MISHNMVIYQNQRFRAEAAHFRDFLSPEINFFFFPCILNSLNLMYYEHATKLIFCGWPKRWDFENHVAYFYLLLSFLLSYLLKIVQQSLCVLQFEKMAEYLSSTAELAAIRSLKKTKDMKPIHLIATLIL